MWLRLTSAWESFSIGVQAGVAAGLLLVVLIVWFVRRRRAGEPPLTLPSLAIDVAALAASGPQGEGPRLELYGTPVRVAVVVVAPVGRDGIAPSEDQVPLLVDQMVPGLQAVLAAHGPQIVCWPAQLSSQGFMRSFFHNVALPGDRGQDTPWCSAAGKFRAGGCSYLAGIVFCAAESNGLGQFEIRHIGQWNDMLRIRDPHG